MREKKQSFFFSTSTDQFPTCGSGSTTQKTHPEPPKKRRSHYGHAPPSTTDRTPLSPTDPTTSRTRRGSRWSPVRPIPIAGATNQGGTPSPGSGRPILSPPSSRSAWSGELHRGSPASGNRSSPWMPGSSWHWAENGGPWRLRWTAWNLGLMALGYFAIRGIMGNKNECLLLV